MFILKGFVSYPELVDNAIGVVAPIGEISKDSLTYSTESGFYRNPKYPSLGIHTFTTYDTELGKVVAPQGYIDLISKIADHLLVLAKTGVLDDSQIVTFNQLDQEFGQFIEKIEVAEQVTNLFIWFPSRISFKIKNSDTFIQLWFSNSHFETEYDEYEFKFIGPVDTLDDFFKPKTLVTTELLKNNQIVTIERINEIKESYPYTSLKAGIYNWVNPVIENDLVPTNWVIVVYGKINSEQIILNSLRQWILQNSTHSAEEWAAIFPDIFKPTEFIVTPMWHTFAIPNKTVEAGFNSPIVNLGKVYPVLEQTCQGVGYTQTTLLNKSSVLPTNYSSLALLFTANTENRDNLNSIEVVVPDYINVSSSRPDFSRMSPFTQSWSNFLYEILDVAYRLKETDFSPLGYTRIVRGNMVYVYREFGNISYMVVTRESLLRVFELETPYIPGFDDDCGCDVDGILLDTHLAATNPHDIQLAQLGLSNISGGLLDIALVYPIIDNSLVTLKP